MSQKIITGENSCKKISEILAKISAKKFLLVCESWLENTPVINDFKEKNLQYVKFTDFTPNPTYEQVCEGVNAFRENGCDAIVSIGGGSTIDVSKCIKLFAKMKDDELYLNQEFTDNSIPLISMPTTAGTGSESTRFAVIYYKNTKQSVTHDSIVPDFAILDSGFLSSLPKYQKICTMLDALCQAIESWWSVNSNDESIEYSKKAIDLIMQNKKPYIEENSEDAAEKIMLGANYAGRAINLTTTTAAHAMSYKLTSMYGLPHGHAVAICLPKVWAFMLENKDACIDKRGADFLGSVFEDIAQRLFETDAKNAVKKFEDLLKELGVGSPTSENKESDIAVLVSSVNVTRLSNNPARPREEHLKIMYEEIVK